MATRLKRPHAPPRALRSKPAPALVKTADRDAGGKKLRDKVPRDAHGVWLVFALAYADQAEQDHGALKAAVRAGIVDVQPEH